MKIEWVCDIWLSMEHREYLFFIARSTVDDYATNNPFDFDCLKLKSTRNDKSAQSTVWSHDSYLLYICIINKLLSIC